jgi:hypothetical protein
MYVSFSFFSFRLTRHHVITTTATATRNSISNMASAAVKAATAGVPKLRHLSAWFCPTFVFRWLSKRSPFYVDKVGPLENAFYIPDAAQRLRQQYKGELWIDKLGL